MKIFTIAVVLLGLAQPVFADSDAWVNVDRLNRRTCGSENCGIVGKLLFREKVVKLQEENGWVRITKYYDANCVGGISQYVDAGNNKCDANNGIEGGAFAEWVSASGLSGTRPADPSQNAEENYRLIKGSDDFRIHKDAFARAANELITSGRCTANDFQEMGGWMKSSNSGDAPIYFTYCGGMTSQNKVYLNASTGEVMR